MPPANPRTNQNTADPLQNIRPGVAFVVIIFGALLAFEIFNYTTTEHALSDLLGPLKFAGIPWATVLALAFCGIDFAGIARLFTPEQGMDEPKEVWYLFGAWLLAATMNAILTWWGVSMAITSHPIQSSSVVDPATIVDIVPVFVAIMVWVIRILIIGTLSLSMDHILHPGAEQHIPMQSIFNSHPNQAQSRPVTASSIPNLGSAGIPARPAVSRATAANQRASHYSRVGDESESMAEPTYHNLGGSRPVVNRPDSSSGGSNGTTAYRRS